MTMTDVPLGITEFDDFVQTTYLYKSKEPNNKMLILKFGPFHLISTPPPWTSCIIFLAPRNFFIASNPSEIYDFRAIPQKYLWTKSVFSETPKKNAVLGMTPRKFIYIDVHPSEIYIS